MFEIRIAGRTISNMKRDNFVLCTYYVKGKGLCGLDNKTCGLRFNASIFCADYKRRCAEDFNLKGIKFKFGQ